MNDIRPQANNQVMVIQPYRAHGTWVFDDPVAGLVQEPFVAGIPAMIDLLVEDIPNASQGFRLLFSADQIPGFQVSVVWLREENGGNWYKLDDSDTGADMEGWLCPALFRYFEKAPDLLYVKAEAVDREAVVDSGVNAEIEKATQLLQEELSGAISRCLIRAKEIGISEGAIKLAVTRIARKYVESSIN